PHLVRTGDPDEAIKLLLRVEWIGEEQRGVLLAFRIGGGRDERDLADRRNGEGQFTGILRAYMVAVPFDAQGAGRPAAHDAVDREAGVGAVRRRLPRQGELPSLLVGGEARCEVLSGGIVTRAHRYDHPLPGEVGGRK